jgi:hypothetical protein
LPLARRPSLLLHGFRSLLQVLQALLQVLQALLQVLQALLQVLQALLQVLQRRRGPAAAVAALEELCCSSVAVPSAKRCGR